MANMKVKEDIVLFGNGKDFESDGIFEFIVFGFCIDINTGSHTIVWTHENTGHTKRDG